MSTNKDPRNEVGAIVHAVSNKVLSDHTAKNIFGNVNYTKHFLQGTVVGFFNGRTPGGKNAIWKLTVDFEMPSDGAEVELKRVDIHRQHCILGAVPAGKNPHCSVTSFTDSIGDPDHAVKGSSTYLPNAEARAAAASAAAASTDDDADVDADADANANADTVAAAPHISLSLAPLVAAPADDDIKIVLPPPPPPAKTKRKRKKATSRDDASTVTPPPHTAPATKKSKATKKKKKASKTVDLREHPVWAVPTDDKKHRVVPIAHEQKWVAGFAATITGDVTDEHTSIHQWFHKDQFGERIAPGNPEHSIMSPLQAFLHMMPPAQLTLILELTNERLVEKEKQEMTRQELLRGIGVCVLIASINFRGRCHNLWEGGGAASKYLPSYDLRATGMSRNRFEDIWYAVRWFHQPHEQPHGMSSEQNRWMLVDDFVANINKYRTMTFVPGGHLEADESMIRWYGIGGSYVDAGIPDYAAIEKYGVFGKHPKTPYFS